MHQSYNLIHIFWDGLLQIYVWNSYTYKWGRKWQVSFECTDEKMLVEGSHLCTSERQALQYCTRWKEGSTHKHVPCTHVCTLSVKLHRRSGLVVGASPISLYFYFVDLIFRRVFRLIRELWRWKISDKPSALIYAYIAPSVTNIFHHRNAFILLDEPAETNNQHNLPVFTLDAVYSTLWPKDFNQCIMARVHCYNIRVFSLFKLLWNS